MGVDAVVDDADAAAKRLRKTGGLPVGGADARGGKRELQQVVDVFELDAAGIEKGVSRGKVGIKAHISAGF